MIHRTRPYLFYDVALSVCSTCFRKIEGKIVFQDDLVFMLKTCPQHGYERVLLADDVDYYRRCREIFLKTPEMPLRYSTPVRWGCPYDCGLCTDHEQHSCVSLIEICDACNLRCPICYASSSPERQSYRTYEQVCVMLDNVVRNEGHPDVLQISGGEPTIHPDFFRILDAAKQRPIRHLMVNTNGIRIATDPAFAERIAGYMPDFEIYLQFDSLSARPHQELRGADLIGIHQRAIERLNRYGISTTLVVTLKKGVNDCELGAIIDFALRQSCVRGVTFQPILQNFDPARDRLTLTEVRRRILDQTSIFRPEDLIPVPCHPDCLAMAYALKTGSKASPRVTPLTGLISPEVLINAGRNTIVYEQDDAIREGIFRLFATNHSPETGSASLRELLCCLPKLQTPAHVGYENVFRVLIVQFMDAHSFDVRSVKKTCIHIAHTDGRLIPFDTYNLFYRDDLEQTRLAPLRVAIAQIGPSARAVHH